MFDMELVNIAIVILNYLNYWDTLACVKSIKSMHYSVAGIVIVDNGSPNESFDVLNEEYKDEECILVIKNKKNQGFARGNNLGINRARKSLKADFVLVINNDIIFTDECYFDELMNAYYPGVGVMGSSIINMKGMPQLNEPYYFGIRDLLFVYLNLYASMHATNYGLPTKTSSPTTVLHGCALFFTPDFFRYYNGFYKRTFLYREEPILYLMCEIKGLKQIYVDSTSIIHLEDKSSEESFGNKAEIKRKYLFDSQKYLIMWAIKVYLCKIL